MMSFYALSATLGGTGKLLRIVAAIFLFAGISATQASAGELSAQPRDSLGVVGSSSGALPQAGGAVASESGWLQRFHVTGYLSQQFGMWQNPSALRSLTPARNNLAVARTTLQVDENFQLDEHNSFFMREWFTYDPPYSWNSANNRIYSRIPKFNPKGKGVGAGLSVGPHSYGHFANDALNQYDVRDAWWQNKWGPLTTFVGNQIVVWGQSLSFRVGDIVNPSDTGLGLRLREPGAVAKATMDGPPDTQPARFRAIELELPRIGLVAWVGPTVVGMRLRRSTL